MREELAVLAAAGPGPVAAAAAVARPPSPLPGSSPSPLRVSAGARPGGSGRAGARAQHPPLHRRLGPAPARGLPPPPSRPFSCPSSLPPPPHRSPSSRSGAAADLVSARTRTHSRSLPVETRVRGEGSAPLPSVSGGGRASPRPRGSSLERGLGSPRRGRQRLEPGLPLGSSPPARPRACVGPGSGAPGSCAASGRGRRLLRRRSERAEEMMRKAPA